MENFIFVQCFFYQREETNIMGSLIEDNMEIENSDRKEKNKDNNPKNTKKSKEETKASFSKDVRSSFANHGKVSSTKKERCSTNDVVHLQ